MTYIEQIRGRQEFNREIASLLTNHPNKIVQGIAQSFLKLTEKYPRMRAGQIICNYICGDYRDPECANSTKVILDELFPGNPDPFFEESYGTLKRLKDIQ